MRRTADRVLDSGRTAPFVVVAGFPTGVDTAVGKGREAAGFGGTDGETTGFVAVVLGGADADLAGVGAGTTGFTGAGVGLAGVGAGTTGFAKTGA